jgi:hypothetical protein
MDRSVPLQLVLTAVVVPVYLMAVRVIRLVAHNTIAAHVAAVRQRVVATGAN